MFLSPQLGWTARRHSCLLFFPHLCAPISSQCSNISRYLGRWIGSYLEARVVWLFSLQDKMRKKRHNESRGKHAGLISSRVPFVVIVNALRSHFKVSFVLLICVLVTGWFNETGKEQAFTFLSFHAIVLFIFCAHKKTIQIHLTWGIVQAGQINQRVDFLIHIFQIMIISLAYFFNFSLPKPQYISILCYKPRSTLKEWTNKMTTLFRNCGRRMKSLKNSLSMILNAFLVERVLKCQSNWKCHGVLGFGLKSEPLISISALITPAGNVS